MEGEREGWRERGREGGREVDKGGGREGREGERLGMTSPYIIIIIITSNEH